MSVRLFLLASVLLSSAMMSAGCSSGHPTVTESGGGSPTPPPAVLRDSDEEESSGAAKDDDTNAVIPPTQIATNDTQGPCVPHAKRECIKSAKVGGRVLCFKTEQVCKADGKEWHPCGENISLGSE